MWSEQGFFPLASLSIDSYDDYSFQNLAVGNYIVQIEDADGCIAICVAEVKNPGTIADCITEFQCIGNPASGPNIADGFIGINVEDGTLPIEATIVNNPSYGSLIIENYGVHTWENFPVGSYMVQLKDAGDCTATNGAEVTNGAPPVLVVECSGNPTSAPGASDGSITLTVAGVTIVLIATADGSIAIINSNGDHTLSGLPEGSHVVEVTNIHGDVVATCEAVIEGGAAPPIEIVCNSSTPTSNPGASNGTVTITITGLTSQVPVTADGSTILPSMDGTYTIGSVSGGTHEVHVQINGEIVATCEITVEDGEIDACEAPGGLAGENQTICFGETATIGCEPIAGYCYHWSPTTGFLDPTMVVSSMPEVSPEETTTYTLVITDDDGNLVIGGLKVTIEIPSLTILSTYSSICETEMPELVGDNNNVEKNLLDDCENNTTTLFLEINSSDYSFLWSNGETTSSIDVFEIGSYYVTATDNNGCSQIGSFELNSCVELNVTINSTQNGETTLDAGAGYPSYQWTSPAGFTSDTPTIDFNELGIYSVTVTNDAGCVATNSINICIDGLGIDCNALTAEDIACIQEYQSYLEQIDAFNTEDAQSFCSLVNELLNAPPAEDPEIHNGIEICNIYLPNASIVPGPHLAFTTYRHPHSPPDLIAPDLAHGIDGDVTILTMNNTWYLDEPNAFLETSMQGLLTFASDETYDPIAVDFMDRFTQGMEGDYEHSGLNEQIMPTKS